MEIKNRLFPYPVLSIDTDDYENSSFSVDVDVEQDSSGIITFSFSVSLDDSEIQRLINHGEAYFAIHFECSKTAYRKLLVSSQKTIVFHVQTTRINGDIALVGMVLAKKDIVYYRNENLNIDYKNADIFIPCAGIIAYQNMPKIRIAKNYEELTSSESFFSIIKRVKDNDDMHPIEFELTQEKIRIVVDEKIYSAYIRYSMDDNSKNLLWSLLLMPAVTYMLERLRMDGIDTYEESEWYQKISNSYNAQGLDFEDTVSNRDNPITDIAQTMLRLPIGKSFSNLNNIFGG